MRVILKSEVRGLGRPGDVKDVADGCALQGGNPHLSTVVPGKTVGIHLTVSCGSLP